MMPLAWLSYGHALVVWSRSAACCLAASLAVIARELDLRWSWRQVLVTGAVVLPSRGVHDRGVTCELTFVLMLPFTFAWRAWRRGPLAVGGRVARSLRQRQDLPAAVPLVADPASPMDRGPVLRGGVLRDRGDRCRDLRHRNLSTLACHAERRLLVVDVHERVLGRLRFAEPGRRSWPHGDASSSRVRASRHGRDYSVLRRSHSDRRAAQSMERAGPAGREPRFWPPC